MAAEEETEKLGVGVGERGFVLFNKGLSAEVEHQWKEKLGKRKEDGALMCVSRALTEWDLKHRGKWPEFGKRVLPHWKGTEEARARMAQISPQAPCKHHLASQMAPNVLPDYPNPNQSSLLSLLIAVGPPAIVRSAEKSTNGPSVLNVYR